ncbi:toxin-antitoxin system, antitoxin component,AbrB family [Streptococcus downei MFe28]|uniref:Toxin-antitoxin system, antitoxin component,AbrB family n=2 Tax=Streptococcus downei TaxID=1317 RepID=A0A380JBS4_STRDO|nr:toxin-antitoxin system, antitoxin component,AbrB family [Streptococcus downei MFe28]
MMTVKTRKQGNSIMITIPKDFNIPTGKEYEANLTVNGEIVFTPKEDETAHFVSDIEAFKNVDKILKEYDGIFKELVER